MRAAAFQDTKPARSRAGFSFVARGTAARAMALRIARTLPAQAFVACVLLVSRPLPAQVVQSSDYLTRMESALGDAYSEPVADVRGYIDYVRSQ